eukprot:scaffold416298_cov34-Prasinocladus_malaysianus.AAC.1
MLETTARHLARHACYSPRLNKAWRVPVLVGVRVVNGYIRPQRLAIREHTWDLAVLARGKVLVRVNE